MTESKYSFYKYCQSDELEIKTGDDGYIKNKWKKVQNISEKYDHWLTSLFKSIKSLKLDGYSSMFLLPDLPMEILFDQDSNLQSITINDKQDTYVHCLEPQVQLLEIYNKEFDTRYKIIKAKCQQHGKNMKILQNLKYNAYWCSWPQEIETLHLCVGDIGMSQASALNNKINVDLLSHTCKLTCTKSFSVDQKNINQLDYHIDTLRLVMIDFFGSGMAKFCHNEKAIEMLNLDKTLVNFTLYVEITYCEEFDEYSGHESWFKAIDKVLCKEYFHNLENVNILIMISDIHSSHNTIKPLFKVLKKHCRLLKNQFKQLNIGLKNYYYCSVFEWNSTIDESFLNNKEKEIYNMTDTFIMHEVMDNTSASKFDEWKQQWC